MARSRSASASVMPPEVLERASALTTSAATRSAREASALSMIGVQTAITSNGEALLPATQSTGAPPAAADPAAADPAAASARPKPNRPARSDDRAEDSGAGISRPNMARGLLKRRFFHCRRHPRSGSRVNQAYAHKFGTPIGF